MSKMNIQCYSKAVGLAAPTYPLFIGFKSIRAWRGRLPAPSEYIYARPNGDGYSEQPNGVSKRLDKLFLRRTWVKAITQISIDKSEEQMALPVLNLEDEEKLRDTDGNTIEVEVLGERHPNKVYFSMRDISEGLQMKNLKKTMTNEGNYVRGEDYVCLVKDNNGNYFLPSTSVSDHDTSNKALYLTYAGLLCILFNARANKTARKFINWAIGVIQTAHIGTPEAKQKLAGELLGVDKNTIKAVFSKCSTNMSCIYLIYLGPVKGLRSTLNIADNYDDGQKVYKFGRTDNLTRRMGEHSKKYGALGCHVELVRFSPIDPKYTSEAEADIGAFFTGLGFKLDNKDYIEITIFSDDHKKVVNGQYELIADRYMGKYKDIKGQIDLLMAQNDAKISNIESEYKSKLLEAKQELIDIMHQANQERQAKDNYYMAKIHKLKAKLKKYVTGNQ